MPGSYQRDYLVRLPLPMAQLYARAYNGKDARSRHQNTFYLFESTIKLSACALVAAYRDELRRGGPRAPNLDTKVAKLAMPSLGDWRDLVREGARHFSERPASKAHPLTHVWTQITEPRRDREALLELFRRIKNGPDGQSGGDKSCSLMQVFDAIVPYRNLVIGHGADRGDAFYDRDMGPRLFPAANELLAEGTFDLLGPPGTRLVFANQVRVRDDNRFEVDVWDLVGLEGERAADLLLIDAESSGEVKPGQVSVLWPGHKLPLSIDPLLVYRDVGDRRELRFLNGDRNGKHVEYLSYTSGMIDRDASTVAALVELLQTVTGDAKAAAPSVSRDEAPPAEFEILGRLGTGSTGKVYLARQLSLGRLVALKTLSPDLTTDSMTVARFRREIETLARCDDPHVVKILSHGKLPDGKLYYAMEYVPGAGLDAVIEKLLPGDKSSPAAELRESLWSKAVTSAVQEQQARMAANRQADQVTSAESAGKPPQEAANLPTSNESYIRRVAQVARDAARALQVVHEQGLIHRDVRPGNLMLTPDGSRVVLMDFGFAKRQSQSLTQSWTAGLVRASRYAAPEQLAGGNVQVGPAADVRGLGATCWELFTRRQLFEDARDDRQLAAWVLHREVPRLREIDPSLDLDLEAIVARATDRSAEARIQTARELADYFDLYLADKALPIRPPSAREVLARWVRQHRPLVATAAASLLAVILVTVVAFVLVVQSRNEAVNLANKNAQLAKSERAAHQETEEKRVEAVRARDETQRQLLISDALRLAAESQLARDEHGVRAVLLAIEALRVNARAQRDTLPTVLQAAYDSLASIGGQPLSEQDASATCAALSRDGRWLAVGGREKTMLLKDLAADAPAASIKLPAHEGKTMLIAFSPDSRWLVSVGNDREVRLWELAGVSSAALPKLLEGHVDDLTALAFSDDGSWLATADSGGDVRLWPTSAQRPNSRSLQGPRASVRAVAFSPDGLRIAAGGADETVYVWPVAAGESNEPPLALRGNEGSIECLAFSPDGRWLASGSFDRTARLWNMQDSDPADSVIALRATAAVLSLCFSPDRRWLATGGGDGATCLWDLSVENPDENPLTLSGHRSAITQLAWSNDGDWLVSGGRDHQALLWNVAATEVASPIVLSGHEQEIASLAFTAEGKSVVTAGLDGVARRWWRDDRNLSADCVTLPGHADAVWSLAFSHDGRWFATCSREKSVRLWDLQASDPAADPIVLTGHVDNARALSFSPDGQWLATGSWDKTARLWRLSEQDPSANSITLEGHNDEVSIVAFSDDGSKLVTAGWDKTARVWSLATEKPSLLHVLTHPSAVTAAVFDHPGGRLATASDDNSVRLWDIAAQSAEPELLTSATGLMALSFTGDDKALVAAGLGGVVAWQLDASASAATGGAPESWFKSEPDAQVCAATISGEGNKLCVATRSACWSWNLQSFNPSGENAVLTTDVGASSPQLLATQQDRLAFATGQLVQIERPFPVRLASHDGETVSLAISPDGKWLAAGNHDGAARLWPLETNDLINLARRAAGRDLTEDERRSYRIGEH